MYINKKQHHLTKASDLDKQKQRSCSGAVGVGMPLKSDIGGKPMHFDYGFTETEHLRRKDKRRGNRRYRSHQA
jgi:hypothetical protein